MIQWFIRVLFKFISNLLFDLLYNNEPNVFINIKLNLKWGKEEGQIKSAIRIRIVLDHQLPAVPIEMLEI